MSAHIAALFLSFIVSYSAYKPSNRQDCAKSNGYSLVVARDMARDANDVSVIQGDKVLKIINLPGQSEVGGFSLRWAKKTKAGFEIAVDYGTRIYFHKRFVFVCKRRKFYLSRVIVDSFDKLKPVKTKSGWEFRIKTGVVKVKPNLPLEKFLIADFI